MANEVVSNVLVQLAPGATTETDLYKVISGDHARLDELVVCNRSAVQVSFRVSISVGGGATQTKDYIYYDLSLSMNDTFANEMKLTLNSGDVIRVYASSADLTFTLFGQVT